MKDMIRVVLIDPVEESRGTLQQLLSGLGSIWLTEVCPLYSGAIKVVTEQLPHLAIVNLDADPEASIKLVGELARTHPSIAILPASQTRDGDQILRVMRAGAREFLPLPTDPHEVLSAVSRLVHTATPGTQSRLGGRVITVLGASGGVGCTSLAVNLATTLAKHTTQSVALADFDLLLGVVDACLDIIPAYTMLEVAQNSDRLDLTLLKRSMTRHESGLFVLPRPIALEDAAKIDPEALRRVIGLLKAVCSTVVIDASKALQASDFVAFESSDVIILVVVLELNCLRNSARLLQLFRQMDGMIDRIRVVVNRNDSKGFDISIRKAEEVLNLPVSWQIPNASRELNIARARGVPVESVAPRSAALRPIREMAEALVKPQTAEPPAPRLARFAASFF